MEAKLEILKNSAQARENDIALYQINIDNYRVALADIEANYANDADMAAFAGQLKDLLRTSLVEQRKEQIMLDAICKNMEA